jgi:hypothetical protein
VGAAAKGPASHGGPANLHYMAGALPKRRTDGEAGGMADAMAARWSYFLQRLWLGYPTTPLEGGVLGRSFLTRGGAMAGGARWISPVWRLGSAGR